MSTDEKDPEAAAASVEPEDVEEGEITDDEEVAEEEADDKGGGEIIDADDDAMHPKESVDNDVEGEADAPGGKEEEDSRRARKEKKRSKRDKERKRQRDIDSDEEKKRRLKKKLAALEMQMQEEDEDDEAMGIYASGGSPPPQFRRRRVEQGSVTEEDSSSGGGGGGDGSRSPQRKRKRSREKRREKRAEGRRRPQIQKSSEICQLFMLGKCPKSPERCIFSHDAKPPQVFELCKFYLFERCAKKEKCLYLHKGFPCKYYHTGHRCLDTAETCKFSHEPLHDDSRTILLKHLESAPKEILGDFPRLSRDAALNLVCKTECDNKGWTTHPMQENNRPPPPPSCFGLPPNQSAGPQFPFNNSRPAGEFDQGAPGGGGFPPQQRDPNPFRSRPPMAQDNFAGAGPPPAFGRAGGSDFGTPPSSLLGDLPPTGNFGGGPPHPPNDATTTIQQRLVQMSQRGGAPPPNSEGPPPPEMDAPPEGSFDQGPPPPLGGVAGGGAGGERRRKSRWEDQESNAPPPPPNHAKPHGGGEDFHEHPPIMNQSYNSQMEYNGPQGAGRFGPMNPGGGFEGPRGGVHLGMHPGLPGRPGAFDKPYHNDSRSQKSSRDKDRKGPREEQPMEEEEQPKTPPNTDTTFAEDDDGSDACNDAFNPASDDSPAKGAPSGMPKAQQRLYQRIQGRAANQGATEDATKSKAKLNESWYSSDEENNKSEDTSKAVEKAVSLPKELTDVISSLKKSPASEQHSSPSQSEAAGSKSRDPRKRDPRRDPRMQKNSSSRTPEHASEAERDKRILEMDLGSVLGDLDLPTFKDSSSSSATEAPYDPSENDMGLPFKPHVVASVAKEIDASIYSHSPLEYRLRTIATAKPDYSELVTRQRLTMSQSQDPRLRRYGSVRERSDSESSSSAPAVAAVAASYNPGQDLNRAKRRDPRRRD
jgi:hypothetical protein